MEEGKLQVELSPQEFASLKMDFSNNARDTVYIIMYKLRLYYNRENQILIICDPESALHERATGAFIEMVVKGAHAILKDSGFDSTFISQLRAVYSPGITSDSLDTTFKPDNGIKFGSYSRIPQLIVEAGVSQSYKRLIHKAGRWLRDFLGCQIVILVVVKERRRYKPPARPYNFIGQHERQQRYMLRYFRNCRDKRHLLGPFIYNSHTWFEGVVDLFIEEVRLDTNKKLQTCRVQLIKSGVDVSQTEPRNAWRICLGDLIPEVALSNKAKRSLLVDFFDQETYLAAVRQGAIDFAVERFVGWVRHSQ
ncbi:hypothetical protein V1525DRAFT_389399 [Lipomyces kononenkoae]|uniref:Uncharacterized protein n=1 Tax=Lipomyces kononenkoae TaxID=34357 RepID=A0ACC3SYL0_LIPKO